MSGPTIVVVNYEGEPFLRECLASVERFAPGDHELIVVDNASRDGSVALVRESSPRARVIESAENRGFGSAANLGVAAATRDTVVLLNNDARLVEPIDPLLELLQDGDGVGAVGGRITYPDGRLQLSVGREHSPWRIVLSWLLPRAAGGAFSGLSRVERDPERYDREGEVAWISGAFLLTPRELWEQLGGMDERYFMYMEDVDYCRRVRESGRRVLYCPRARVVHAEAGGKPWIGADALIWTVRSYLHYTRKFYGRPWTGIVRVGLGGILALRAAACALLAPFAPSGWNGERARGYGRAVRALWSADV